MVQTIFRPLTLTAVCLALALFSIAGCEEKAPNPVQKYGDELIKSYDKSKQTQAMVDIVLIKRAISMFNVQNGRYPESIEEIESFATMKIPDDLVEYDPSTGSITKVQ